MAAILWRFKVWCRWIKRRDFEWWARVLTIGYLSLFLGVVVARIQELISLPLNELGDFAAGAFGPLAFLWLVLGYRQQGQELRASSVALEAQVDELRKNIEIQQQAAAREDLTLDPVLELTYVRTDVEEGREVDVLSIFNRGHTCRDLLLKFMKDRGRGECHMAYHVGVLATNAKSEFILDHVGFFAHMHVTVDYSRSNGSAGSKLFWYIKSHGSPPTIANAPPDISTLNI